MEELHQLKQQVFDLLERVAALEKKKTKKNKTVSSMMNLELIRKHIEENYAFGEPYILSFKSNEDISAEVSKALQIPDDRKTRYCIGVVLGSLGAEKTFSRIGKEFKRGYKLANRI